MPMQRIGLDAGRAIPVTRQGRATRDAIMRAALAEISECGYLDARVESITHRAGVGYGTFYKYFSGKRDLVRAALSEVFADIFMDAPAGSAAHVDEFLAERVERTVATRLRAYHRHRRTLRVLMSAIGVDPELASAFQDLQREQVNAYAETLATSPGYQLAGTPLATSFVVTTLIDEVGQRWVASAAPGGSPGMPRLELAELTNTIVPMILAAVAPQAAMELVARRASGCG